MTENHGVGGSIPPLGTKFGCQELVQSSALLAGLPSLGHQIALRIFMRLAFGRFVTIALVTMIRTFQLGG